MPSFRPIPALVVCLHDVWPGAAGDTLRALDVFEPLLGRDGLAAAIVPAFHGHPWRAEDRALASEVSCRTSELLLHGFSHRRRPSLDLLSALSGWSDELKGRSEEEIDDGLADGLLMIDETFESPCRGFLPPAWRRGPLTSALLRRRGFDYLVGPWRVETMTGERRRLATWSWDWGPIAATSRLAKPLGWLASRRSPDAACVAIHPIDSARGNLPLIRETILRLLDRGCRPTTFSALFGGEGSEAGSRRECTSRSTTGLADSPNG